MSINSTIIDETCANCTIKETETELCENCFRKKLEKRRIREEMQKEFSM